jgi:hypothetical protein
MPDIALEKVCYVIVKAREFDVKVEPTEPHSGSNPSDDGDREVLEDYLDDPTYEELKTFLDSLNQDELAEIQALMWIGRGDYDKDEWDDVVKEAMSLDPKRTPDYLIGTPLLGDYLEEGLNAFDLSCEDFEMNRL